MTSISEEFEYSCDSDDNHSVTLSYSPSDSEKKQSPGKKNEIASEKKPFVLLKRLHSDLPLETKVEIIQRLQNGESPAALAAHYSIGQATIFYIKSKKDKMLNFASEPESDADLKKRKTMRRRKANKRLTFCREDSESESNPDFQDDEDFAKDSNYGSSSTSKRKHKVLSIETKLEIIKRLENGKSLSSLASIYNVTPSAILYIKKQKMDILKFAMEFSGEDGLKNRKSIRKTKPRRRKANKRLTFCREDSETESNPDSQDDDPVTLSYSPSDSEKKQSPEKKNETCAMMCAKDSNNGSSSTLKRKHKLLSLETKLEIIKRLENGKSISSLASIYNVTPAAILYIKRQKMDILKFAMEFNGEDGLKNRKSIRKTKPLQEAIYQWYEQNLKQGKTISSPLIQKKALNLNRKFGGPRYFKASTEWLQSFRSRYGIKQLVPEKGNVTEEKPSEHNAALDANFNLLHQGDYSRDDIYITEKFKINLKSMPTGLSIYQQDPSYMSYPTFVTIMMCANSNWTHALPLLMIGKSKKEKCFKNAHCLPLLYKSEKKASLDSDIFIEWYENEFIPAVTKERSLTGKSGKVLLCLGNERFFPSFDTLNVINDDFRVTFLSPVQNTVVHAIDQAVINKFKSMFKIQLINQLLLFSDSVKGMVEHAKKITIKEFSYMLCDAWNSLTEEKLTEELIKLCGLSEQTDKPKPLPSEKKLKETIDFIKLIRGLSKCDKEKIRAWLCFDYEHQVSIKQEIIWPVIDDECIEDDEDCKMDCMDYFNKAPSHSDAFTAFETIIEWCELQNECSPDQLLCLKRLKDLASNKSLKEKEIKIKQ